MVYQNLSLKFKGYYSTYSSFAERFTECDFVSMFASEEEHVYYATFLNFYKTCPSGLCFVQYYLSSYTAIYCLEKTTSFRRFVFHVCMADIEAMGTFWVIVHCLMMF